MNNLVNTFSQLLNNFFVNYCRLDYYVRESWRERLTFGVSTNVIWMSNRSVCALSFRRRHPWKKHCSSPCAPLVELKHWKDSIYLYSIIIVIKEARVKKIYGLNVKEIKWREDRNDCSEFASSAFVTDVGSCCIHGGHSCNVDSWQRVSIGGWCMWRWDRTRVRWMGHQS